MKLRRVRFALVLAAVTTIALVGCAPAISGPSHATAIAKPTIKPSPKRTIAPAIDVTAPSPRLNIPCNTLVPPSAVSGYQGAVTLVQPAALAAGDLADPESLLPAADYTREAGGIQCIWSAGPVDNYIAVDGSVPALLEVTVQFDAQTRWPTVASDWGIEGGQGGECDVDDPGSICQNEDLIGTGTWIEIYSRHATGAGEVSLVENAARAAVMAAGAPSALPAPQAGTLPTGAQCTDLLSTVAAQTALGSPALTTALPDQGQADDALQNWVVAQDSLHDHPCLYSSGSTVQAKLAWIPGGAWAWNEDKTQTLANAPLQTLALTGLHAHDGAWTRCAAGNSSCVADLVVGGNWIEVTVPSTSTAANKKTAVTAAAQAIVNKVG